MPLGAAAGQRAMQPEAQAKAALERAGALQAARRTTALAVGEPQYEKRAGA